MNCIPEPFEVSCSVMLTWLVSVMLCYCADDMDIDESNAESRHRKRVCVDTALKMLSNIHKNPTEPKFKWVNGWMSESWLLEHLFRFALFYVLTCRVVVWQNRSIRLSNSNFRSRVAEVEGGLETMMGGGFELHETEEETFLQWNPSGSQHDGDLRLAYTINRLVCCVV